MEITFNDGTKCQVSELTFKQWRKFMHEFMSSSNASSKAWDLMSCVRGPDSPSERSDMPHAEHKAAYAGRRARKYDTVEAIREEMFFGATGGTCRHHKSDHVTVPPEIERDHFDHHVVKAAKLVGLEVRIK